MFSRPFFTRLERAETTHNYNESQAMSRRRDIVIYEGVIWFS